jgi:hypothetical protein
MEQLSLPLVENAKTLSERGSVLTKLVPLLEHAVLLEPTLQILDELGCACPEGRIELLNAAWDPDRPRSVAEVSLDLAVDRRDRERRKINTAVELEPVDRVDQPDRADLDEILELLAPADVAPSQLPYEREVLSDQAVARRRVSALVVRAEEPSRCVATGGSPRRAPAPSCGSPPLRRSGRDTRALRGLTE